MRPPSADLSRPRISLPRLYAILDVDVTTSRGLDPRMLFETWLDAGVRLIQLRAKTMASGALIDLADALADRASTAGAIFVVNDRADIAALCGASGVHLGQTDLSPADARRVVGADALVGLSTHSTAELTGALARDLDHVGIGYVAVGAVFATTSKPAGHPVVGLSFVREAATGAARAGLPLVAIGGITVSNAASVVEAGATSVAVISDLLAGDAGQRARQYLAALA